MNKTLHKNLTESSYTKTPGQPKVTGEANLLIEELEMLMQASKKLLQPRPEAVTNILKLARAI